MRLFEGPDPELQAVFCLLEIVYPLNSVDHDLGVG